jgi:hypothetical protein
VIKETTCNCSDSLDVHLRTAEFLFAMFNRVLKIFKGEDQLQQTVGVQLKRGCVVSTLWHVMSFVKYYDGVFVIERIIRSHRFIKHVVVGH